MGIQSMDVDQRQVRMLLPSTLYSLEGLRITAAVFDQRCEVYHESRRGQLVVTLQARRKNVDAAALEIMGGEFLNELLNQEYRFIVARSNRRIADVIVAQSLLSARGGQSPLLPVADDPQFEHEAKRLMDEAAEEIRRTMPSRLPPQAGPILPAMKDASA